MKIAIVCDDLTQFGGAEKVMLAVSEIWSQAPVYTCFASKKWQKLLREKNINLRTSFMQKIPFVSVFNRYFSPFLLHFMAYQSFNFSEFDVVLSLSSRFAHHIHIKTHTAHVCYMHSPGRMFWESLDYFQNETYGLLKYVKKLAPYFLAMPTSLSRLMDYFAGQRVDYFIANSVTSQKRIEKYYRRTSEIINPFPSVEKLNSEAQLVGSEKEDGYFFIITRLAPWKKLDIAIKACEKLKVNLKISGAGPDASRLKEYAGPHTELLGHADDSKKVTLYKNCKALIVTQLEDFGMVALEAMSFGKPVIAFGKGGALETIVPGKTGEFFYEQTPESLQRVLEKFDPSKYNPQGCVERAKLFSKEEFSRKLLAFVNKVAANNVY